MPRRTVHQGSESLRENRNRILATGVDNRYDRLTAHPRSAYLGCGAEYLQVVRSMA